MPPSSPRPPFPGSRLLRPRSRRERAGVRAGTVRWAFTEIRWRRSRPSRRVLKLMLLAARVRSRAADQVQADARRQPLSRVRGLAHSFGPCSRDRSGETTRISGIWAKNSFPLSVVRTSALQCCKRCRLPRHSPVELGRDPGVSSTSDSEALRSCVPMIAPSYQSPDDPETLEDPARSRLARRAPAQASPKNRQRFPLACRLSN